MRIFEKTETAYTYGLGTLIPSLCTIREELNGEYEMEMKHPYDEWGKWKRLEHGRIVMASTPNGEQPFRIYHVEPDMGGIKINARHIFYDLLDNVCGRVDMTGTPEQIFAKMQETFNFPMPFFTFSSDIATAGRVNFEGINPVAALLGGGKDGMITLAHAFGGELERDGGYIAFNRSVGTEKGVVVRYGKNMSALKISENWSGVKTRIICRRNGAVIYTVDSPYIGEYMYPRIHVIDGSGKADAEMRKEADALMASGIDLPLVNISVDFVSLEKTVEYSHIASLERLMLGDLVGVVNEKMGFEKTAKVIAYEWDSLLERYINIELGEFMPNINSAIDSGAASYTVASDAASVAADASALIRGHIADYANPHRVTAEQIGGATQQYVDTELAKIDARLKALGG